MDKCIMNTGEHLTIHHPIFAAQKIPSNPSQIDMTAQSVTDIALHKRAACPFHNPAKAAAAAAAKAASTESEPVLNCPVALPDEQANNGIKASRQGAKQVRWQRPQQQQWRRADQFANKHAHCCCHHLGVYYTADVTRLDVV
jgi:hypothetical protein